jgi:hypothetical protein
LAIHQAIRRKENPFFRDRRQIKKLTPMALMLIDVILIFNFITYLWTAVGKLITKYCTIVILRIHEN